MADIEPAHIFSSLRTLLPDSGASDETKIEAASLLWDISADAALAALLVDHSAVPLLLRNLSDAGSSARLCEVSAGALANLAADPNVCTALVQHVDAPAVLGRVLLESADAATLFESVRVFQNVFLSHGTSGRAADDPWLTLLCEQHVDKLLFVLLNTLRGDLCERTAALLGILARSEATCAIFLRSQSSMSSVFAALLERWRAFTNEGGYSRECRRDAQSLLHERPSAVLIALLDLLGEMLEIRGVRRSPRALGKMSGVLAAIVIEGEARGLPGLLLACAACSAACQLVYALEVRTLPDGDDDGDADGDDDGDAGGGTPAAERLLLNPRLLLSLLRLLRRLEDSVLGTALPPDAAPPPDTAPMVDAAPPPDTAPKVDAASKVDVASHLTRPQAEAAVASAVASAIRKRVRDDHRDGSRDDEGVESAEERATKPSTATALHASAHHGAEEATAVGATKPSTAIASAPPVARGSAPDATSAAATPDEQHAPLLRDGLSGAWALLCACASYLDGFSIALSPDSTHAVAFYTLMHGASALVRACRWAQARH